MKKKLLEKRLKSYSALAAGVLAAGGAANGQVVYTDVDPDSVADADGESYELDLNNDGTIDFTINRSRTTTASGAVRIVPQAGNEVLGATSYGGAYFLPYALSNGDAINGDETLWNGTINSAYLTLAWYSTYGYWAGGQTDKYLGLRIDVDGAMHYGWVRLDVAAGGGSFTLKDYAFVSNAGVGIEAGATEVDIPAALITDLTVEDITDNGNGSDLQVDFNRPTDESTVAEYRIMVVESANAGSFDLAAAEAVAAGNYTIVETATKGDVTVTLAADAKTVDGTLIANGVAYKIFVLSMADGTNAVLNALSAASEEITLIDVTSVDELQESINVYTYGSMLAVDSKTELQNAQLSVYDVAGRQVYSDELSVSQARIQLDRHASKFYLVRITTAQGHFVKKVFLK